MPENIIEAKPILRWAGGKNWLVKHLHLVLPKNGFENYHEPFLGGASIFLAINPKKNAYLSDLNEELIDTYVTLKSSPKKLIQILKTFENSKEFYYKIRASKFDNPLDSAARFIYLNQTSFNGIYRVNLKGDYNVPFGYRTKNFLEVEKLKIVSKKLENATLFHGDFMRVKAQIKKNDLVFLDPPYTVSHNKNGFIKYNQRLFSIDDQNRLSELIDYIKRKDAFYILTNAAHPAIEEIFEKGDRLIKLERASLIGGSNAERGKISEYLFTNTHS